MSNFSNGSYKFTRDLLQQELASTTLECLLYPTGIASPLIPEAWEFALRSIPDRAFATFLLRALTSGFQIGVSKGLNSRQLGETAALLMRGQMSSPPTWLGKWN